MDRKDIYVSFLDEDKAFFSFNLFYVYWCDGVRSHRTGVTLM